MIEKIEHFGAELDAIPLLKFPILGYREINVSKPGLPHESALQITKLPGRRCLECSRIEINRLVGTVQIDGHTRNQVRAEAAGGVSIQAKILPTDACLNVERRATQHGNDPVELPVP